MLVLMSISMLIQVSECLLCALLIDHLYDYPVLINKHQKQMQIVDREGQTKSVQKGVSTAQARGTGLLNASLQSCHDLPQQMR